MTSRREEVLVDGVRLLTEYIEGLPAWVDARDHATVAATVDALAKAGLLRQRPAQIAEVTRIVRDERGAIVAAVKRVEQIEGGDPPKAA